jgi:hypothetical protein
LLTNSKQCDVGAAYCDAKTCLKAFSGAGSTCKGVTATTLSTSKAAPTFPAQVPEIDVCGSAQGGVTCPGVGANVRYAFILFLP